jgi:transcriptional regulator with XRE-family HTH domain
MRKGTKILMTGQQLRRLRAAHKLSQARFAALLGIHPNTLARYERGELAIAEPVARLARILSGGPR